jgi:nitrogen regulatory protein P-II 1
MYKLEAVIRSERLECVKEKLVTLGFSDFNVSEVRTHDAHAATALCYRGANYAIPYRPQVRLELVVPDSALDVTIENIVKAAFTGEHGDGKVLVSSLCDAIDISAVAPRSTPARQFASARFEPSDLGVYSGR